MCLVTQLFTVALLLISVSSLDAVARRATRGNVPCPRCSSDIDVTWATDGSSCFVFRSPCLLLTENCGRDIEGKPLLTKIEKVECQKLCRDVCAAKGPPLCATCNNQRRTFGNECNLANHVCRTGEICELYRVGQVCENVAY